MLLLGAMDGYDSCHREDILKAAYRV